METFAAVRRTSNENLAARMLLDLRTGFIFPEIEKQKSIKHRIKNIVQDDTRFPKIGWTSSDGAVKEANLRCGPLNALKADSRLDPNRLLFHTLRLKTRYWFDFYETLPENSFLKLVSLEEKEVFIITDVSKVQCKRIGFRVCYLGEKKECENKYFYFHLVIPHEQTKIIYKTDQLFSLRAKSTTEI